VQSINLSPYLRSGELCCRIIRKIQLHYGHQKEGNNMPAIKPISELRNYNTVLREVTIDTPVFLTKNGHGRFAIVDIRSYERLHTELELMSSLAEGEESARKCGWVSMDSAMKQLGV
jgi:prevent-host-death family protein